MGINLHRRTFQFRCRPLRQQRESPAMMSPANLIAVPVDWQNLKGLTTSKRQLSISANLVTSGDTISGRNLSTILLINFHDIKTQVSMKIRTGTSVILQTWQWRLHFLQAVEFSTSGVVQDGSASTSRVSVTTLRELTSVPT